MFVRAKTVRGVIYLQIVENQRVGGRTKQRVVSSLGRLDQLQATGSLESLSVSLARFSEQVAVLGELKALDVSVERHRQRSALHL